MFERDDAPSGIYDVVLAPETSSDGVRPEKVEKACADIEKNGEVSATLMGARSAGTEASTVARFSLLRPGCGVTYLRHNIFDRAFNVQRPAFASTPSRDLYANIRTFPWSSDTNPYRTRSQCLVSSNMPRNAAKPENEW